jgi:hypothetical protein
VNCTNCPSEYRGRIQFKVGEVWQYSYEIGDTLKVKPGDTALSGVNVMAYGFSENPMCPACGFINGEEYDILIMDLTIVSCKLMVDFSPYRSHDGGEFYFLPDDTKT